MKKPNNVRCGISIIQSEKDNLNTISSNIIVGKNINAGTGYVSLQTIPTKKIQTIPTNKSLQ